MLELAASALGGAAKPRKWSGASRYPNSQPLPPHTHPAFAAADLFVATIADDSARDVALIARAVLRSDLRLTAGAEEGRCVATVRLTAGDDDVVDDSALFAR